MKVYHESFGGPVHARWSALLVREREKGLVLPSGDRGRGTWVSVVVGVGLEGWWEFEETERRESIHLVSKGKGH